MEDGTLSPPQKELLRRANRQAFEMSRLAENARLLGKLREGVPLEAGPPVRIGHLFEEAAETVRSIHFDRKIELSIHETGEIMVAGFPLLDNVVLTPHIGWKVDAVFAEFAEIAREQLASYIHGDLPRSEVLNPEALDGEGRHQPDCPS